MAEPDLVPLVRLPRHDAELGGLDLFSRLDDAPLTIALNDPARVEAVMDRFRDGVLRSLQTQSRVFGWHVQAMFGEVVRALGGPMLMTEDDQGATWSRPTERVKPTDYRIVLPDELGERRQQIQVGSRTRRCRIGLVVTMPGPVQ